MAEAQQEKVMEAPAAACSVEAPVAPVVPETVEEKGVVAPPCEEKAEDSKSLVVAEKTEEAKEEKSKEEDKAEKSTEGSVNRDAALARVETEKRLSLVKAWEENEKTKAENKAVKKLSSISSWENTNKAVLEAKLKKMEEEIEIQKAEYAEKVKNKMALIHKQAEEKKALTEAKRGEEVLKASELAAKYRVTGLVPKKIFGCFGV